MKNHEPDPVGACRRRCVVGMFILGLFLTGPSFLGAQEAKIASRSLSEQEIHDYGLPENLQISGGLNNVGIGAPLYLEVQVPKGTVVNGVTWSVSSRPQGSAAELTESPLSLEIPVYNPGDREVNQAVSRRVLVPDVLGHYTVAATVSTSEGDLAVSKVLTGSNYIGVGTTDLVFHDPPQCARCHPSHATSWAETGHASALKRKIDGIGVNFFASRCLKCHTTGFDDAPAANNGGFDDVARMLQWAFPETIQPGNWEAMPLDLKAISNVQCESCHGPGEAHSRSGGNPDFITMSTSSGDCGQCHDAQPYHTKNTEWNLSGHAVATRYPTGEGRENCVGCHSGIGFIDRIDGVPVAERRTEWEAITCASCHDPHDGRNPHQLRKVDNVTLMNGVQVPGGGNGRICMNCHISRRNGPVYAQEYHRHYGPHGSPQTDMLAGTNAIEYDRHIPSSAHLFAVQDSCTTCHMHETERDHPAHNLAGGHTFKPIWDGGTADNPADDVHLTQACANCHGPIENFNFPRQDFDGDGAIEGVQTEVHGLMEALGVLLPPLGEPAVEVTEAFTPKELKAAYNYKFVEEDGSHGIHNTSYAVNILKASIADMTGDGAILGDRDNDCLPDDWEVTHFGSITAQDKDGDPDGDGISNSFELMVGTNPAVLDSDMDGFTDFEELHAGTDPLAADNNPEVGRSMIYTAAEMLFFTEPGKFYQVQTVSRFGADGWINVGEPIEGNGGPLQQFISTRDTEQGFYRVVEVPAP